ncbi:MAG: hypothetical protein K9K75_07140, partial [Deltaproteobacteria bacterium]|nr:hypothetical protein [Deltaproteobacteria bacterium]
AGDVARAILLLKSHNIKTSIHLMVGLPLDTEESFMDTVQQTIKIGPTMVRIHPTLVFSGTPLAELWEQGRYSPLSLEEAVTLCAKATAMFLAKDIAVIRLGLQLSEDCINPPIAGPYHPSLGSLVYKKMLSENAHQHFSQCSYQGKDIVVTVSLKDRGIVGSLQKEWKQHFGIDNVVLHTSKEQKRGSLEVSWT